MKGIMTQIRSLLRAACYYLQLKGTLCFKTLQLKDEECRESTQAVPFARVSQRKRVPTTNRLSTFIMM